MIIRKKTDTSNNQPSSTKTTKTKKTNIIKKEDANTKILESKILDNENVQNTNSEVISPQETPPLETKIEELPEFEKIDISSIEFKERIERRRGDRRRGYRRIDERSLVSRAQQEAHTIKELAAREGYQNGLKRAQDEINEIKTFLLDFVNLKDEMYEKVCPHIIEIALAAAKKIIKKEVELSQDILKEVVLTTLDELSHDVQKIEIKVNPDDFEFAFASLPEIIEAKGSGAKMTVSKDETISKGSCVIVANNGVIDANFKTQLQVLQSAFGIYEGGL